MKLCYKCNTELELSLFNKDKCKADGYSTICKSCRSKYAKSEERKTARKLARPKKLTIKNLQMLL